jgi:serine/threonine protein kinase
VGSIQNRRVLGAGGMGYVYRATDSRLGRAVAIKFSRKIFSQRFEREGRVIAALNHPNVCTLHDVGQNYMVMELLEGETLACRLRKGRLAMADTLRYGGQVADALAAAHAKGITHRDLKPSNIMLTKAGVKVLDFGLAKSREDAP